MVLRYEATGTTSWFADLLLKIDEGFFVMPHYMVHLSDDQKCCSAMEHDNIEALKWLRGSAANRAKYPWGEWSAQAAINHGSFDALRWAVKQEGFPALTGEDIEAVIWEENMEILNWIRSEGLFKDFTKRHCELALRQGSLVVLKWLVEDVKAPWNILQCWKLAVVADRHEILNWLRPYFQQMTRKTQRKRF